MGTHPTNRKHTVDTKHHKPRPEDLSIVEVRGVSVLAHRDELLQLAQNHIEQYRNPGDVVHCDDQGDTVTYRLAEKNLSLSLAKRIAAAYKGNHPEMTVRNPERNEFYRIDVVLQPTKKFE